MTRASNRLALEHALGEIPLASFIYHADRNDFSRWLFARSENFLARHLRPVGRAEFQGDMEKMRTMLQSSLAFQRRWRQKGVVVDFSSDDVDLDSEFLKIGRGSLGGKARGLAFFARLLKENHSLYEKFTQVNIIIPQTLVLTTEIFDDVVSQTGLARYAEEDAPNEEIASRFLAAAFPAPLSPDCAPF